MYDSFTIKWRGLGDEEPSSDMLGQRVSELMLLLTVLRFMESGLLDQSLLIGACVLPGVRLMAGKPEVKIQLFQEIKTKDLGKSTKQT